MFLSYFFERLQLTWSCFLMDNCCLFNSHDIIFYSIVFLMQNRVQRWLKNELHNFKMIEPLHLLIYWSELVVELGGVNTLENKQIKKFLWKFVIFFKDPLWGSLWVNLKVELLVVTLTFWWSFWYPCWGFPSKLISGPIWQTFELWIVYSI